MMDGGLGSLLRVSIDFETSHLFFPRLVLVILAVLLPFVLLSRRRELASFGTRLRQDLREADHVRLLGTIVLTIAYFMVMPRIGDLYPNTGLGFYLASIPYLFAVSVLYLHERSKRTLTIAAMNAVIAPSVCWYALTEAFNLSLP